MAICYICVNTIRACQSQIAAHMLSSDKAVSILLQQGQPLTSRKSLVVLQFTFQYSFRWDFGGMAPLWTWNGWDGSHLSPSQTPTNQPSQFFWHIITSVPKRNEYKSWFCQFLGFWVKKWNLPASFGPQINLVFSGGIHPTHFRSIMAIIP